MPVCVGVMALGIDVSYWEVNKIQLQRIADVAALAGSARYSQTNSATSAVQSAASVAELNGVPAGTRTTSGSTVLTDNYGNWVTSYALNATAVTLTATLQTSVPIWFAGLYTTATSKTISATAVAQTTNAIGGHPCIVALKGDTTGVITYVDLTFSGNTTVNSTTCGIRSDGGISISGNSDLAVQTVIVSGTIRMSGNGAINCPHSTACQQQGAPQIPDPLSAAYANALSVPSGTQPGSSTGSTYNPGLYPDLSFSGNGTFTLNPGVYYVDGSISFSGNVSVSGSGVTLISTDGISMSGNTNVTLTAPSTGQTAGLVLGTSATSGTVSLSGNSTNVFNGAVYAPNANVKLTGNANAGAANSTCFEIVASTVTFSGNSDITNSGCGGLGVPTLDNSPPITRLIQ